MGFASDFLYLKLVRVCSTNDETPLTRESQKVKHKVVQLMKEELASLGIWDDGML